MVDALVGEAIQLPTRHGVFMVRHVSVVGNVPGARKEGVALVPTTVGLGSGPVMVRLQSSCLFSESFWATDCDCRLQLDESLARISKAGGVFLYFYEEGRGAGLMTKIQAIWLQQNRGKTTSEAYACLNLQADERTYEAAAAAIRKLLPEPQPAIVLLTNNPSKVRGLKGAGLLVESTQKLICGADIPQVRKYLEDKRDSLHHDIDLK